jgi:hypothetical protein
MKSVDSVDLCVFVLGVDCPRSDDIFDFYSIPKYCFI